MSKYQTFEDLQALGSEKIHERTHISRDKIELVLTKSYGEIGRVQFMGFISILEREYGIGLNAIREEYTRYWEENADAHPPKRSVVLQAPSNTTRKWVIAGAVAVAVLLAGGYYLQNFLSNAPREEVMKLSSLAVEPLPQVQEGNLTTEANATADANRSVVRAEANATAPLSSAGVLKSITFHPKYKVWVGTIDLSSGAKTQQTTSDPVVIDTAKNWIVVFGHGMLEIESPSGKQALKEAGSVRFAIENGALKPLSRSEFLERNGGKNW